LSATTQVQIISASSTVLSNFPGFVTNIYMAQAKAYNESLSPGQSEWLVCDPCDHSFPSQEPGYLLLQLANLYNRVA
jgi:hypothetical protein